jgi:hypothetical protein
MRPFVCMPLGALCALMLLGLCPLHMPMGGPVELFSCVDFVVAIGTNGA